MHLPIGPDHEPSGCETLAGECQRDTPSKEEGRLSQCPEEALVQMGKLRCTLHEYLIGRRLFILRCHVGPQVSYANLDPASFVHCIPEFFPASQQRPTLFVLGTDLFPIVTCPPSLPGCHQMFGSFAIGRIVHVNPLAGSVLHRPTVQRDEGRSLNCGNVEYPEGH